MIELLNDIANSISFELLEDARKDLAYWVAKHGSDAPEVSYKNGYLHGILSCTKIIESKIDELEKLKKIE